MSATSTIEWTDATWNPITGCSVTSPGCKNCYAMKLAGTRLRHHPSREGLTLDSAAGPVWNGQVRFNEGWLMQPLAWKRPRTIFVCAHGDLFHESAPDDWIDRVFAVMALTPWHTFQVLTKRADQMRDYLRYPAREALIGREIGRIHSERTGNPVAEWTGLPLPNVWLGVSAEDQRHADARIPHLLQVEASVRFVSLEPLLSQIDLSRWLELGGLDTDMGLSNPGLDWVIVGGESGPGARPMHSDWARSLRDQCQAAGVPFFFKQWGEWGYTDQGSRTGNARPVAGNAHIWPQADLVAWRVGKEAAGRLLDGRTWDEVPR